MGGMQTDVNEIMSVTAVVEEVGGVLYNTAGQDAHDVSNTN